VDFGSWEMPLFYRGTVAEHMVVRNRVGIFDVSHMGRIDISGKSAMQFVDYLCTNSLMNRSDHSVTYAVMCNDSGGTIDDTLVYQISTQQYFIVANAANRKKDLEHLIEHSAAFDCKVHPRFSDIGIIAVQGPQASDVVEEVFQKPFLLRPIQFTSIVFQGEEVLVSRTGYTGSLGYELFMPLPILGRVWDALLASRCAPDILPCGLGARDTLRLEAGYALYGHELNSDIAPTESISAWTVNWKKDDFIGKEALLHLENSFNKRTQYGLKLIEPGIAREGCTIWKGQRRIGVVTSGTHSPFLDCSIAIIMVTGKLAYGEMIEVEIRKRRVKAEVVKLPFTKG